MKVTLSTGIEIEIATPPVFRVYDLADKMYPPPDPPVVEDTTVTGETIRMEIVDDPGYLAEVEVQEARHRKAIDELSILLALRSVEVPEDFDVMEFSSELQYMDPDWKPRDGEMGQKLDYIEFVLLAAPRDQLLVQEIVNDMCAIDQEEIAQVADSFRS